MDTFINLAVGWVFGIFTVFGWAFLTLFLEQRKVAKANITPKGKLGVVRNTPSEYN